MTSRPESPSQHRSPTCSDEHRRSTDHGAQHVAPSDHDIEEKPPFTATQDGAVAMDTDQNHVSGLKLFTILASVTAAAFLMLLDGSIIGVVRGPRILLALVLTRQAIPKITSQFHSLDDIGWYTAAYQLASAALQPLSGKIYTHISTKVCESYIAISRA